MWQYTMFTAEREERRELTAILLEKWSRTFEGDWKKRKKSKPTENLSYEFKVPTPLGGWKSESTYIKQNPPLVPQYSFLLYIAMGGICSWLGNISVMNTTDFKLLRLKAPIKKEKLENTNLWQVPASNVAIRMYITQRSDL